MELIQLGSVEDKNGTWVLKENEYFIVGDNRAHSYDSRDFGPVAKRDILQRLMTVMGNP